MAECGFGFVNVFGVEGNSRKVGCGRGIEMDSESCGRLGGTPQ